MTNLEALRKTYLFQSLPDEQIERIRACCTEGRFAPGEELFGQGQSAPTLHVLLDGSVAVWTGKEDETDLLASTLGNAGSVLGTASLLPPFVYNVTAKALTHTRTLAFSAADLKEVLKENPAIGLEVMTQLAQRYLGRLNTKRVGMMNVAKALRSQVHKSSLYDVYMECA
jgi:CRP-like cAMP-binding protein